MDKIGVLYNTSSQLVDFEAADYVSPELPWTQSIGFSTKRRYVQDLIHGQMELEAYM